MSILSRSVRPPRPRSISQRRFPPSSPARAELGEDTARPRPRPPSPASALSARHRHHPHALEPEQRFRYRSANAHAGAGDQSSLAGKFVHRFGDPFSRDGDDRMPPDRRCQSEHPPRQEASNSGRRRWFAANALPRHARFFRRTHPISSTTLGGIQRGVRPGGQPFHAAEVRSGMVQATLMLTVHIRTGLRRGLSSRPATTATMWSARLYCIVEVRVRQDHDDFLRHSGRACRRAVEPPI